MTEERQPDSLTAKILSQAQAIRPVEDDEARLQPDADGVSGDPSD